MEKSIKDNNEVYSILKREYIYVQFVSGFEKKALQRFSFLGQFAQYKLLFWRRTVLKICTQIIGPDLHHLVTKYQKNISSLQWSP
jgi:hypothetical protein